MTSRCSGVPGCRMVQWVRAACLLVTLTASGGCVKKPYFKDGVVHAPATTYSLGPLGDDWTQVGGFGGDVGFISGSTSAVILANASCDEYEDAPLDALTKHLLIGFTDREVLSKEKISIDGRAGLATTLLAQLDGVPVKMRLVVLKKDWCIYDMSLTAPVALFDQVAGDFEAFARGFGVQK